jgi:HptB-dependent secretion and biofilm anti anti-sigma factor
MHEELTLNLPSRFDYTYHTTFLAEYTSVLEGSDTNVLVLDFRQVNYLDSSALGMLVMLQKKYTAAEKKVKIKSARGATKEILTMANMQKLFEFVD